MSAPLVGKMRRARATEEDAPKSPSADELLPAIQAGAIEVPFTRSCAMNVIRKLGDLIDYGDDSRSATACPFGAEVDRRTPRGTRPSCLVG
jgi:hypothetical protein